MTAILGISAFYHDSAAALVVDGRIIAAAQEERFTREKHDHGFPGRAIAYCLEEAGIGPADLNYVGFYDKPLTKFRTSDRDLPRLRPGRLRVVPTGVALWLNQKLRLRRDWAAGSPTPTGAASSSPTTTSPTPPARSSRRRSTRPPS
ncbi:MAG: carbamoyltransferase N-terminal domain-containing protein [Singulisphaera sp.]